MPDDPKGPAELPSGAPKDLRDFVRGRSNELQLKPGEVDWVPGVPTSVEFAATGEGVTVKLDLFGGVSTITLGAEVKDGRLVVDTEAAGMSAGPISSWVDDLNDDMSRNGRRFDDLSVTDGDLHLGTSLVAGQPVPPAAPPPPPVPAGPPPAPLPRHVVDPIPEPVDVEAKKTIEEFEDSTGIGAKYKRVAAGTVAIGVAAAFLFFISNNGDTPPPESTAPEAATSSTGVPTTTSPPEGEPEGHSAAFGSAVLTIELAGTLVTGEDLGFTICATDSTDGTPLTGGAAFVTLGNDPASLFASHGGGETGPDGCHTGTLRVQESTEQSTLRVSDGNEVAVVAELPILPGDGPGIDGVDPEGDQENSESQAAGPDSGSPGGDIVMVEYTPGSGGAHTFTVTLAGDGSQHTMPGSGWMDVIVLGEGDGDPWRANGAWFSGEYQDRGIRVGPAAPGQTPLDGATVLMEFAQPHLLVIEVDGGETQLDFNAFQVVVGVSTSDEVFWDSAVGAGPP